MKTMQVIKRIEQLDIDNYLTSQGNFKDNKKSISNFRHYYVAELTENEFFDLCFLGNEMMKAITLNGRGLKTVAETAIQLIGQGKGHLGANWNLKSIEEEGEKLFKTSLFSLENIVIKDHSSPRHKFYIQDGNHRCLSLAIQLLKNGLSYSPVKTFVATNSQIT
jgi:hypothetical protein